MRTIELRTRTEIDWSGKFVDETAYDVLLSESAVVYKPDGTLLCALLKRGHSPTALAEAWSVLKTFNQVSMNRGVASGADRKDYVKKDGTVSNTQVAEPVNSGIVGYFERNPRFPYCRACAWNLEHPEKFKQLERLCREASAYYEQYGGEKYLKQKKFYDQTHADFKIPGTVFSTLTVNKNFRTACHRDAGNLVNTLNVMSVIREGKFRGCNIVFPDFRVAAELDTGDCIVFDAHEFHGNTRLIQISKEFKRCSVVFYYRENMDQCLSASEELDRAKNRSRGEALFDRK